MRFSGTSYLIKINENEIGRGYEPGTYGQFLEPPKQMVVANLWKIQIHCAAILNSFVGGQLKSQLELYLTLIDILDNQQ